VRQEDVLKLSRTRRKVPEIRYGGGGGGEREKREGGLGFARRAERNKREETGGRGNFRSVPARAATAAMRVRNVITGFPRDPSGCWGAILDS